VAGQNEAMKRTLLFVLALAVIYGSVSPVYGQQVVTSVCNEPGTLLVGSPVVSVVTTSDGGKVQELTEEEALEYQMIVSCDDEGRVVWSSRENRELIYNGSGIYRTLVSPVGSGSIRLLKDTEPLVLPSLGVTPEKVEEWFLYSESITNGLDQISYYGRRLMGVEYLDEKICSGLVGGLAYPSRNDLLRECRGYP
jgi:hypothetical protein